MDQQMSKCQSLTQSRLCIIQRILLSFFFAALFLALRPTFLSLFSFVHWVYRRTRRSWSSFLAQMVIMSLMRSSTNLCRRLLPLRRRPRPLLGSRSISILGQSRIRSLLSFRTLLTTSSFHT